MVARTVAFDPIANISEFCELNGMDFRRLPFEWRRSAMLMTMGLIAAATTTTSASACSVVLPPDYEGSSLQKRRVKEAIKNATAIVDGEVVRPWTKDAPALVRVHHVLKGTVDEIIQVGGEGVGADCSIALERPGERIRMILNGGPVIYDLYYDQSEARLEDRFLKSDRRKVWPYHSGRGADRN